MVNQNSFIPKANKISYFEYWITKVILITLSKKNIVIKYKTTLRTA